MSLVSHAVFDQYGGYMWFKKDFQHIGGDEAN